MAVDKSRTNANRCGCSWVEQNVADELKQISIYCSQSVFSICTDEWHFTS